MYSLPSLTIFRPFHPNFSPPCTFPHPSPLPEPWFYFVNPPLYPSPNSPSLHPTFHLPSSFAPASLRHFDSSFLSLSPMAYLAFPPSIPPRLIPLFSFPPPSSFPPSVTPTSHQFTQLVLTHFPTCPYSSIFAAPLLFILLFIPSFNFFISPSPSFFPSCVRSLQPFSPLRP